MLDIGWVELLMILVVAVIFIGPKELPGAMRSIATLFRRMRWIAENLRNGVNQFIYQQDISELETQVDRIKSHPQTPQNPEKKDSKTEQKTS